jgi:hypothetical protein
MKSCPKCNRTFPDETQKFCTFDGGLLISSQPFDPNATVRTTVADIAPPPPSTSAQDETSRDLPQEYATLIDRSAATTSTSRDTAPTSGQTTIGFEAPPSPSPPPSVTPPPVTPPPATAAPPPVAATAAVIPTAPVHHAPETVMGVMPPGAVPPKKKSKVPLIVGALLLLLLLGGGALAGAFFMFIKPRLDQQSSRTSSADDAPVVDTNKNTNAETTTTPVADASPSVEEYVPPAGTTPFVNSKDTLDGRLAEHYFDFSFYYPSAWTKDPKAGVPGAANFARVERHLPPDFTQESFSVGWYTSAGSFVADLPNFPRRAEEFSASLSKIYPEYEKVSEGPTKINSMDAYEFRWQGLSKGTEKGDIQLWGRVVFLPTGNESDNVGATLTMLTTSLAGELSSVEDVGERGQMPVILESFRFGKKQ